MCVLFASTVGVVARLGPIVPFVPAGLNVWQEPHPLETNTAFPVPAAAVAGLVVCAVVSGCVVGVAAVVGVVAEEVAGAETVTVWVRVPPAV
jgi:hypothetical protein